MGIFIYTPNVSTELSPAGVVDMDSGILGLILHAKHAGHRVVFHWESGVEMDPLPLFGAGTPLPYHQRNSPSVKNRHHFLGWASKSRGGQNCVRTSASNLRRKL